MFRLTAWGGLLFAVLGVVLSAVGFVKYCRHGATNRDTAIIGAALGWLAAVIIFAELSLQFQVPPPPVGGGL